MYDGEIRINTKIDTAGLDKGVNDVQSKLSHTIKGLSSIVKGAGLAVSFAGIAQGISKVAEATEALEDSIRKASTLFGDVAVDIDNLRNRILQLSSETGVAASEIGNALYEALSSGVPATEDMAEAMEFLSSSADAAKGGFADLSGTVTATMAVINAYGMSISDAERVQGVLMQTQNKGMTTIGQLASSLAQVIPTAAAFGVSLEQIGAALATSTAAGTQTGQAITGLNQLLSELGKEGQTGAEGLEEAAKAAGLGEKNFQDLIDEGWTLADILDMMSDYAESTDRTLIDMFGSVEAGRTALQLAGENAERFADNLESMFDTAGLAAEAADKVTTNTERLGIAITNAASSIGSAFEPAVQDAAGWLANMINAMFGNRTEAGNLETALDNVKSALERYKRAQDDAKTATDEATDAMIRQNGEALRMAIQKAKEDYEKAMADYEDLAIKQESWKGLVVNPSKIANQQEIVDNLRKNMQEIFNEALGEVDFEAGYEKFITMPDLFSNKQRKDLEEMNSLWQAASTELDNLKKQAADLKTSIDDTNMSALEAYESQIMSLTEIGAVSKDLASWVLEADKAYQKGLETAEAYGAITEENADAAREYIQSLNEEILTVESGSMEYVALRTTIDELTKAYNELAEATGKPKIGVPEAPVKSSTGGGIAKSIVSVPIAFDASSIRTAEQVMSEFYAKIQDNGAMQEIFGDDFNAVEANIEAVHSALSVLINDFDMGPASSEVQDLLSYLAGLESQSNSVGAGLKKMAKELEAWAESAATSFAQSIGSGISDLVTDFMTIDEQVEALNEELDAAKEEQLDRNKDLLEAEEEYRIALLEGNQTEIDAALENLEIARDQQAAQDKKVESLEDEIESTKNGTKAWEDFGRAALLALADVLESLGAQLAAQAVVNAVAYPPNYVNAGIAAAGSVAAYVAAGLIRGWAGKYAKGGVVPQVAGVPSTGDQHIARVNPGELILNKAQQGNIAQLLTSQEALLAMKESEGDRSSRQIVIELNGDVYGLDSEEVGRAIYRNIRSLQEEGRIDRWR